MWKQSNGNELNNNIISNRQSDVIDRWFFYGKLALWLPTYYIGIRKNSPFSDKSHQL